MTGLQKKQEMMVCLECLAEEQRMGILEIFMLGVEAVARAGETLSLRQNARGRTERIVARSRELIQLGAAEVVARTKTVSFGEAVVASLVAKVHRRTRTLSEIRYMTNRMMRENTWLAVKPVRALKEEEIYKVLETSFGHSAVQRKKGRVILHGVLNFAIKRGWASENPVARVDVPVVVENPVPVLTHEQEARLMASACKQHDGACRAAAALMIYTGVRPNEVRRLTWGDVSLEQGVIQILPQHSKTGGARLVTISPELAKILQAVKIQPLLAKICPPNWVKRWKNVRTSAGLATPSNPWVQDILRHTFASRHIQKHKNFSLLQYEMGHRSAELLRTRYISQQLTA